jgi:hypothetical protein
MMSRSEEETMNSESTVLVRVTAAGEPEVDDAGALHRVRPWRDRDETVLGAPVFLSSAELAELVGGGRLTVTVEEVPSSIDSGTLR